MIVTFWGVRGSIPTPGRLTEKYGGNTTCLEVRAGDATVVIDAGTGIRAMGNAWLAERGEKPISASLLFTHHHWDHIQGFPFLTPAYLPGNSFAIYGESRASGSVEELLRGQMQGDYFPVPLSAMRARFEYFAAGPEFALGPVTVRTQRLAHPGGSIGYRLEAGGSTLVFATDCELDQMAANHSELADRHAVPRRYSPELLRFFRDAQLLIIDCQYTDEAYASRRGWGHNSAATVVDLCRQTHPKAVCLCHHDPQSTDDDVTNLVTDVAVRIRKIGVKSLVFAAREGLSMLVRDPPRPPSAESTAATP